jgi:hypothetical protein
MLNEVLIQIATKNTIYDEIIDNIIRPNFHLKPELISELSISFLENRGKVEEVIKAGYFTYYFIRAVKNNVHSNTSPFYKNTTIRNNEYYDNLDVIDEEYSSYVDEMYVKYDRAYVKVPKTHFQEFVWQEYYQKNKTLREIGRELEVSHCLVFHEIKKIKEEIKKLI